MYEGLAFLIILLIGCLSLVGLFFISLKEKTLDRILFVLVAFAMGTILATSIFDLIPESLYHLEELNAEGAEIDELTPFIFVMIGFLAFFVLERFIYWFHGHAHQEENETFCHGDLLESAKESKEGTGKIQNFAILNLVGDGLHNFLDGIIIMVGFLSSLESGIVITLAVLFHELPQEVGDFGILLYGGLKKKQALLFNFLSAMVGLLGGLFAFLLSDILETFNLFFLAFSGGGFLYIACVELMPESFKERDLKKSVLTAIIFVLGILFIYSLIAVLPHAH